MPILGIIASSAKKATAFESIATVTLGTSSLSINFSSIPSTYQSLQIRGLLWTTANNLQVYMNLNGNTTGTNYRNHSLLTSGAAVGAQTNQGSNGYGIAVAGQTTSLTSTTYPVAIIINIENYKNSSQYKTVRFFNGLDSNGSSGAAVTQWLEMGSYNYVGSTAAITSLSLNSFHPTIGFSAGSTLALYGIKG